MNRLRMMVPGLLFLFGTAPGLAASSPWHIVEGGAIRIVTDEFPQDGVFRGALEIRLEPGWKTYWMDPGESGVPPQVDISDSGSAIAAAIHFPPPKRIHDDYSSWAGYDRSVSLALELPAGATPAFVAEVFLGICRTICVPVQAQLKVESQGRSDPEEMKILEQAFTSLPEPADDGFGIARIRFDESENILRAAVSLPGQADEAELFLADTGGWKFGVPVRGGDGFSVPVFGLPDGGASHEIPYTLVSGDRAVRGRIQLPSEPER